MIELATRRNAGVVLSLIRASLNANMFTPSRNKMEQHCAQQQLVAAPSPIPESLPDGEGQATRNDHVIAAEGVPTHGDGDAGGTCRQLGPAGDRRACQGHVVTSWVREKQPVRLDSRAIDLHNLLFEADWLTSVLMTSNARQQLTAHNVVTW